MHLYQAIKYWDKYISDWNANPSALMLKEKSQGHYFHNSRKLNSGINYLPEPYYGDVHTPSVVVIDLNPGLSSPFDYYKYHSPGCFLYDYVNNYSYEEFNELYSPFLDSSLASIGTFNEIPGAKWWRDKRMGWIKTFVKGYNQGSVSLNSECDPLVFELCPWHSKDWNDEIVSDMTDHLQDVVFQPASEAVKQSGLPFGFCFGKKVGDELIECGFTTVIEWNKDNVIGKWPISKSGDETHRSYRLLKGTVNQEDVWFLNLYANGTFLAPSKNFVKNVEPHIIDWLKAYFGNQKCASDGPFWGGNDVISKEQGEYIIRNTTFSGIKR